MALPGQKFLSAPCVYDAFQYVLGGRRLRSHLAGVCEPVVPSARILDIGCGTARILDLLPNDVRYLGLDPALAYVKAGKTCYGQRARFVCGGSECLLAREWDIVLTSCVLHHLNDGEALRLLSLASECVKRTGVFICGDPVLLEFGSPIARSTILRDRGRYMRTPEAYLALLGRTFPKVQHSLHEDLMYIPYSHIIAKCRGE